MLRYLVALLSVFACAHDTSQSSSTPNLALLNSLAHPSSTLSIQDLDTIKDTHNDDLNSAVTKRKIPFVATVNSHRHNVLRSLLYDNGMDSFNITVNGTLPSNAPVGMYQMANGMINYNTTVGAIQADLLNFIGPNFTTKVANHTLSNVRVALKNATALLNSTICPQPNDRGSSDPYYHDELRRLLVSEGHLLNWLIKVTGGTGLALAVRYGIVSNYNASDSRDLVITGAVVAAVATWTAIADHLQRTGKVGNWESTIINVVTDFGYKVMQRLQSFLTERDACIATEVGGPLTKRCANIESYCYSDYNVANALLSLGGASYPDFALVPFESGI